MYSLYRLNPVSGIMKEFRFRTITQACEWAAGQGMSSVTLHGGGSQIKINNYKGRGWVVVSNITDTPNKPVKVSA